MTRYILSIFQGFVFPVGFIFFYIFCSSAIYAEELKATPPQKNGVQELRGNFKIFPYNKLGNTIYRDNKKLISKEHLAIQDVLEVADGIVYLGFDEGGESDLAFSGDPDVDFKSLDGGFYHLRDKKNGLSKLFRVDLNGQIKDLLPKSKTASGLAYNGKNKAAFFHIAKGELVEFEDGRSRYQYTFRIHIVRTGSSIVRTLPEAVNDFSIKLDLRWENSNTLHVLLGNGKKNVYHL